MIPNYVKIAISYFAKMVEYLIVEAGKSIVYSYTVSCAVNSVREACAGFAKKQSLL